MSKKKTKKRIRTILIILMLVYALAAHFIVQAALVPSFMDKLDAFSTFTEKGYSEQVYTEDIVNSMKENKSALKQWLSEVSLEERTITSSDGYKLVAAVFERKTRSDKWALLLHGYTGWKEELYSVAMWFYSQGYNVMLPDMRCHGDSEGDYIGMGYTDRFDNILWLNTIIEQNPDAKIVLYGQSMGGSAVIHLASEISQNEGKLKTHITCGICDSAFANPLDLFKSNAKRWTGLPCFGLVDSAALMLIVEDGYSLFDAKAVNAVNNTDIPLLFIQGTEDKIVDPSNAKILYDACSSEKELLMVEGAGHTQAYEKDPDKYYETISIFINNCI